MVVPEPTLQDAIVALLSNSSYLNNAEPAGLGMTRAYGKWLVDGSAPGAEPDAFNTAGRIKPTMVVLMNESGEVAHPSVHVPGQRKWDAFPSIYLFHWPSDHGKQILAMAALEVERLLGDQSAWHPIITGGQRPIFELDQVTHIDNSEQFPGNYVLLLRFRATGMRFVALA